MLNSQKNRISKCIFAIFGATGDLAKRKLLPALYKLHIKNSLPKNFAVVGISRREKSHHSFREDSLDSLKKFAANLDIGKAKEFLSRAFYFKNNFNTEESYYELKRFFNQLDEKYSTGGNRIFYLATMPRHFGPIIKNIKKYGFLDRSSKKIYRLIIEKPFGYDLESALALNKKLTTLFNESEIYRIDHYLGKESVQNLLALRFANRIFEPVWNSRHISNVQITAAESIGIENRAEYYDNYGALRDMVQNHLLQILSLIAMDQPKSFSTNDIKDQKVKVMNAIMPMSSEEIRENVVFGQCKKYKEEPKISPGSKTETFVALRLMINNKRWRNIPFYLRTGKYLKEKLSEVAIIFKDSKLRIKGQVPNMLVIRLQPNEGIYLQFNAKNPGNRFEIKRVSMDFCHSCLFNFNTPEAYEKLLYDAFNNDQTLFSRWDEVKSSWNIIDRITKYKKDSGLIPVEYMPGTWGPGNSDKLLEKSGHFWRTSNNKNNNNDKGNNS